MIGVRVTPDCDTISSIEICTAPYIQTNPAVVYNDGKFVVVWSDVRFSQNYYWLVASCVDTAGVVLDTGYCIGAQAAQSECYPDVASDGSRCLVVWYCYHEPFGVYGRFVDENGQPDDTIITVASVQAGYNLNPKIVFAGDRYFTVWADKRPGYSDLDIYGQSVSPEGQLIGDRINIATGSSNQMYPAVAYNGDRFLVVWREATMAVFGQWLDLNGTLIDDNFCVSDSTPYYRFDVGVGASATNFLVAWSEVHADERDIFGNTDLVTGIEKTAQVLERTWHNATIFRGSLRLCGKERYTLYDVCGRKVTGVPGTSGIYYLTSEGKIVQKLIVFR
ncbi:hypothetical protein KAS45_01750 [candidate division WOR-3 bacterium]|nr:hypothetical protein [candidate division WOR-3 bacterium]